MKQNVIFIRGLSLCHKRQKKKKPKKQTHLPQNLDLVRRSSTFVFIQQLFFYRPARPLGSTANF